MILTMVEKLQNICTEALEVEDNDMIALRHCKEMNNMKYCKRNHENESFFA